MKAVTVRQPYASLIAAGVKTIETRPRATGYRGRIAIHAGRRPYSQDEVPFTKAERELSGWQDGLPLGVVVASAVLTECVPIIGDEAVRQSSIRQSGERLWGWFGCDFFAMGPTGLHDQLPFGDFSPDRWALLLDDIKPTTERCPWCWGTGCQPWEALTPEQQAGWGTEPMQDLVSCPVCHAIGKCDPVSARGQQAVPWEWQPTSPR